MTAIRDEFPIFAAQPAPFHYLDNAATGQICRAAADAQWRYETTARANVKRGVYRLADAATVAFQRARGEVAAYLGAADVEEVVFTSGTTLALNVAAHGLAGRLREGDEILISWLEHHSNIVPWQMAAERRGASVRAIPVTPDGRLDLDRLDEVVTSRTRVISVTHASNVTGAVTDIAGLRDAADAVGRCWCWMAHSAHRTDPSTSRRWAATSTPSRPTRCSAPPAPARFGAERSCWPSCRRSWAAAR